MTGLKQLGSKKSAKIALASLAVVALVIGISVGVTQSNKNKNNSSALNAKGVAYQFDSNLAQVCAKAAKATGATGVTGATKAAKTTGPTSGGSAAKAGKTTTGPTDRRKLIVPGTEEYHDEMSEQNGAKRRALRESRELDSFTTTATKAAKASTATTATKAAKASTATATTKAAKSTVPAPVCPPSIGDICGKAGKGTSGAAKSGKAVTSTGATVTGTGPTLPFCPTGKSGKSSKSCLRAAMSPSNGDSLGFSYPNADGYVTVCFDGALSETSGSLRMNVKGLKVSTTGGVHIHTGTSCTDATTQGGHYFNALTTGDPWFNTVNPTIAPTGTGYTTDSSGTGRAQFQFDQGYGYEDTVGKAVVVHDTITDLGGTYARIACGVLVPTSKAGKAAVITTTSTGATTTGTTGTGPTSKAGKGAKSGLIPGVDCITPSPTVCVEPTDAPTTSPMPTTSPQPTDTLSASPSASPSASTTKPTHSPTKAPTRSPTDSPTKPTPTGSTAIPPNPLPVPTPASPAPTQGSTPTVSTEVTGPPTKESRNGPV